MSAENRVCMHSAQFPYCVQANVNPTVPPKEWPLDALAAKMKQYCYLLDDLTLELLMQESNNGDYEALRDYLRQRGVDAYWQKVGVRTPLCHSVSSPGCLFMQSLMHHNLPMWGRCPRC
jgi:hypothetical protein